MGKPNHTKMTSRATYEWKNTLFDENSVSEVLMVGVRLITGGCDVISGTISSTAASVSSDSSSPMFPSSSSAFY